MASSLDQVGTLTKTVQDAQLLLQAIAGYDDNDAQSQPRNEDMLTRATELEKTDVKGLTVGVPTEFFSEGLDPKVREKVEATISYLESKGATIKTISLPMLPHAVAVYYSLMPAELSTNLARFDGVKYGIQDDTTQYEHIKDYYKAVRSKGF